MRISFFAALRTFLPSFFRNFLHVYIFIVVLSLALNISQNSSLKGFTEIWTQITKVSREKTAAFRSLLEDAEDEAGVILTIWRSDPGHIYLSRPKDCYNPSSPRSLNSQMAWPLLTCGKTNPRRDKKWKRMRGIKGQVTLSVFNPFFFFPCWWFLLNPAPHCAILSRWMMTLA